MSGSSPPTSSPTSPAEGYLPAIDGLRAVAVLAVVAFHADLLVGGYLGVDLFFVISGYLITGLLLREYCKAGRIDLRRFWSRRVKRLLPAAMVTLTLTTALVAVVGETGEARATAKTALASLFSLTNWHLILNNTSYWERFGATPPLTHFWSLSIEEQFYVAWPLSLTVLFSALKLLRNPPQARSLGRWVGAAASMLALLSWNIPQTLVLEGRIDRMYLGTDSRAASLLVGCAAGAFGLARRVERFRFGGVAASDAIAVLVIGVLGWMYWTVPYTETWLYPAGFAAEAILVVILIACALTDDSRLASLLSNNALTLVGRYSYPLYLVHLPVFWLLETIQPEITNVRLFVVGLAVSAVLAGVLSLTVEQRFRHMKFSLPQGIATGGGALAACLATVVVALQLAPVSITSQPEAPGQLALSEEPAVSVVSGANSGVPTIIVIGDSVAGNLAEGLAAGSARRYSVIDQSLDGCQLLDSTRQKIGYGSRRVKTPLQTPAYCRQASTQLSTSVAASDPVAVVWHARGDINEAEIDGTWIGPCDAGFRALYEQRFSRLASDAQLSVGRTLIVIAPLIDEVDKEAGQCLRDVLADTISSNKFVRMVDLQEQYCPNMRCGGNIDGVARFTDAVHLSLPSSLDFARNIVSLVPFGSRAGSTEPSTVAIVQSTVTPTVVATNTVAPTGPVVAPLPLLILVQARLKSGKCVASDPGPLATEGLIDAVRCTSGGLTIIAARYSVDLEAHRATMRWLQTNLDNGWIELTPDGTLSRTQKLKDGVVSGSVRDDGMVAIVAPNGADENLVREIQKLLDPSLLPVSG